MPTRNRVAAVLLVLLAGLTGFAYVKDVAAHLVLPAVTLGLFFMAIYARLTRAEMLEPSQFADLTELLA